jgi:hypothetical protein
MSWRRRSPFSSPEEAASHMVELLAKEAEIAGTPLTDLEKEILLQESSEHNSVLEELRQKVKDLTGRIFEAEASDELYWDPRSFGNSMRWAGERRYPNVVALAEEVRRTAYPQPHGWKLAKDRMQLIACGLLAVLLMFVVVIVAGVVFHWK